jgi:hypothetical protein
MKSIWDIEQMEGEIIGVTPSFIMGNDEIKRSVPRGCEIDSYLRDRGVLPYKLG